MFVAEVLEKWWWLLEVWRSGGDGCSEGGVVVGNTQVLGFQMNYKLQATTKCSSFSNW